MNPSRSVTDLLPLSPPVFHILLALADRQRHGYAMLKEIEERSAGRVVLSTGTLYSAIRRLVDGGLIRESAGPAGERAADERRRYYALTSLGRRVARAEANRLADLLNEAARKQLIGPIALDAPGGP